MTSPGHEPYELESYDELMYDENSSWCDQDASIKLHGTVRLVLCYVVFLLGLLGNSIVIWVLARHIKLKSMTDVYLLSLSLSDLIMALSLPLWANRSQNIASCKLMTGIYQLGFYSGTLFVTLMSVDRYLAVVHAVAAMRVRTLRYGAIASVVIWIMSVTMAAPQVVFAHLELEANSSQCQPLYPDEWLFFWKMQRNFSENTLGLFVCLPIIIFCYVKILMVVSRTRNSKKDKAVRLILTIVCFFVVCWVPYNVTVFLDTLQQLKVINNCEATKDISSAMSFAEIIALSHCCVNPVIYAFIGEKFRKSLSSVLTKSLGMGHHTILRDTTDKETSNTPVRSEY